MYICTRNNETNIIIADQGEMAEWSNAAVLKTVDCNRSGGSNPSFSASNNQFYIDLCLKDYKTCNL